MCVCTNHSTSGTTPCLECGHVFMSSQLPMLAQPSMDSYMETWVPLCASVCVCVPLTLLLVIHFGWNVHASVHEFMSI